MAEPTPQRTRDPDDLVDLNVVAKELGVSYETARTLTVTGRLAFVAVGAGKSRVSRRVRWATLLAFKRAETLAPNPDVQFAAAKAMAAAMASRRKARYI